MFLAKGTYQNITPRIPPYVVSYIIDGAQITIIGVYHTYDFNNEQKEFIDSAWKKFIAETKKAPRQVVVEGAVRGI